MIDFPYKTGPSKINGVGGIATRNITAGEKVPLPEGDESPDNFLGFNHSHNNSLSNRDSEEAGGYRTALRDIAEGEELTVDYSWSGQYDVAFLERGDKCNCEVCLGK